MFVFKLELWFQSVAFPCEIIISTCWLVLTLCNNTVKSYNYQRVSLNEREQAVGGSTKSADNFRTAFRGFLYFPQSLPWTGKQIMWGSLMKWLKTPSSVFMLQITLNRIVLCCNSTPLAQQNLGTVEIQGELCEFCNTTVVIQGWLFPYLRACRNAFHLSMTFHFQTAVLGGKARTSHNWFGG